MIIFTICVELRKPGCLLPFTVYFVNDLLSFCYVFAFELFYVFTARPVFRFILSYLLYYVIMRFHYVLFVVLCNHEVSLCFICCTVLCNQEVSICYIVISKFKFYPATYPAFRSWLVCLLNTVCCFVCTSEHNRKPRRYYTVFSYPTHLCPCVSIHQLSNALAV